MVQLEGRTAIVTGAGEGLGRSHALLLAALGAQVVVNDVGGDRSGEGTSTAASDRVVDEIRAAGGLAVADYNDISTETGAAALVDLTLSEFGGVDVVVNNAGILRDAAFHKMTLDQWDAVLRVHLHGSFLVTHKTWPILREQGRGRVVFTTSGGGMFGNFGQANYGAAKMGIVGLTNCLAIEGRRHDIKVNAVSPIANTRLMQDVMSQERLADLDPAYVSPVVAWLASDGCDVSGEVIRAGGGGYSLVQYRVSEGVSFDHVPTVDEFAASVERVLDMTDAHEGRIAL